MDSTRTASPAVASGQQLDIRSVSACVTAVASAYIDAAKLVERIKSSNQNSPPDPALHAFEQSLSLGAPVVRGQYSKDLERYGDVYADGDQTARENLKDIVINLQLSLLATLRMALLDNEGLDCASLQAASDSSRVDAVLCLSQLGERMANRPSTSLSHSSTNPRNETPTPLLGPPTASPEPLANSTFNNNSRSNSKTDNDSNNNNLNGNNTSASPPPNKTPPRSSASNGSEGTINALQPSKARTSFAQQDRSNSNDRKPASPPQEQWRSNSNDKPASSTQERWTSYNDGKPTPFTQERWTSYNDDKPAPAVQEPRRTSNDNKPDPVVTEQRRGSIESTPTSFVPDGQKPRKETRPSSFARLLRRGSNEIKSASPTQENRRGSIETTPTSFAPDPNNSKPSNETRPSSFAQQLRRASNEVKSASPTQENRRGSIETTPTSFAPENRQSSNGTRPSSFARLLRRGSNENKKPTSSGQENRSGDSIENTPTSFVQEPNKATSNDNQPASLMNDDRRASNETKPISLKRDTWRSNEDKPPSILRENRRASNQSKPSSFVQEEWRTSDSKPTWSLRGSQGSSNDNKPTWSQHETQRNSDDNKPTWSLHESQRNSNDSKPASFARDDWGTSDNKPAWSQHESQRNSNDSKSGSIAQGSRKSSDNKPSSLRQESWRSSEEPKPASKRQESWRSHNDTKPPSFIQDFPSTTSTNDNKPASLKQDNSKSNSKPNSPPRPGANRSSSTDTFSPGSTDLVPHPLSTSNANGSTQSASLNKRSAPNHRRIPNGSYQSSFISRHQSEDTSPRQSIDTQETSQPHHFIAELEGPVPPRPRSQPAEDELSSRQPEGNSVFISADLSSLIGPGPDPFAHDDFDIAEAPEAPGKPLPPDASAGQPMGLPQNQEFATTTTISSSNMTSTSGPDNSQGGSCGGGSGSGGMLSGLKGRAKRFTANPISQDKAAAPKQQQQQDSSKGGRHLGIPKGLKFSGFKRGLGITSNNSNSSNHQHQPSQAGSHLSQQETNSGRPHTSSGQISQFANDNKPLYLPGEDNHFAGFCKGAWKLQNGLQKAFVLEYRPAVGFGQGHMWRCTKCIFEVPPDFHQSQQQQQSLPQPQYSQDTNSAFNSPSTNPASGWTTHPARQIVAHNHGRANAPPMNSPPLPDSSSTNAPTHHSSTSSASPGQGVSTTHFDQAVHFHSGTGIRYRWLFLAKSHVHTKSPTQGGVSGVVGSFGCIFCCALLRGSAPVFGNVHAFMEHLLVHAAEEGATDGSGGAGLARPSPYGAPVSYVPGKELLEKAKCVVGRVPMDHEDFEVNIPPRGPEGA